MDFQKSQIISYNTYRRIAKKHNIKDETSSGKPVTYKKLRNRIQNHKNVLKKKQADGIMSLLITYLNDKIDHDELMSKLNEQINFHKCIQTTLVASGITATGSSAIAVETETILSVEPLRMSG